MKPIRLIFLLALGLSPLVYGQHAPYAGQQARDIKALSDQERADLASGAGAGYAKAAELNRYPGPSHVVELAAQLHLSPQQLEASKRLLGEHKSEARRLGAAVIDAERALDREFASGRAEHDTVRRITLEIAKLQAQLRYEHLETHLAQTALLQPHQVARYMELRGYGGAEPAAGGHKH